MFLLSFLFAIVDKNVKNKMHKNLFIYFLLKMISFSYQLKGIFLLKYIVKVNVLQRCIDAFILK